MHFIFMRTIIITIIMHVIIITIIMRINIIIIITGNIKIISKREWRGE
jgi:hypothetical protein